MKTFELEMRTPENEFLREDVEYVILPSTSGAYGVLANHAPTVLRLETGICEYTQNGEKKRVYLTEGVADVTRKKVTVLSDFIETEENAAKAIEAKEETIKAEKQRRKNSYFEYKQSGVELAKAMRNLSDKGKEFKNL